MKKIFLAAGIFTATAFTANAQNCSNYLLLQNNKRIEMTIYNKKDKEDGKQVWNVSGLKTAGGSTTAHISTEFFDGKGRSINKGENEIKCTGGALLMNMKMMLNEAQLKQMDNATATVSGEFLEYPAAMKEGDQLKDGNFKMNYKMNGGMETNMEISVTNRVVGGTESITSAAGTWNCIKITCNEKLVTKIAGIGIPINMTVTEWFAPGVGIIKTQSKYGSTLITSIQ
ncbi:TapB family protein [Ferruginibacter sp.]